MTRSAPMNAALRSSGIARPSSVRPRPRSRRSRSRPTARSKRRHRILISSLWTDPTNLATAMADSVRVVDAVIDRLLAKPDGPEARVYEAMRYAALAPGKRLRPFLVLASSRLFGVAEHSAAQVAAAIEMVH